MTADVLVQTTYVSTSERLRRGIPLIASTCRITCGATDATGLRAAPGHQLRFDFVPVGWGWATFLVIGTFC